MSNPGWKKGLTYGFGHLVSSIALPDEPNAAASAELADGVFAELGLSGEEVVLVAVLAEHVAANYDYTGAEELQA